MVLYRLFVDGALSALDSHKQVRKYMEAKHVKTSGKQI